MTAATVNSDYLKQVVDQLRQLKDEKKDIAEREKEILDEAKSQGYDKKMIKKLQTLIDMDPDQRAEEEAILELYKDAVGIS